MQPQENLSAEEITRLKQYVQKYFLEQQLNCGLTMMHCLSDFFQLPVHEQVYASVNGIMEHRDKRHQCGLYKGALMFLGIYGTQLGWDRAMLNEKPSVWRRLLKNIFMPLTAMNCAQKVLPAIRTIIYAAIWQLKLLCWLPALSKKCKA